MNDPGTASLAVLVCAPFGRDSKILRQIVELDDFYVRECGTLDEAASELHPGVVLLLFTEEAVASAPPKSLQEALLNQDVWSDLPLILLSSNGATASAGTTRFGDSLSRCANLSILERPIRVPTLRSAIRSATRARIRQYQVRGLLERERKFAADLRQARDELEQRVRERTADLWQLNTDLKREVEERERAERVLRNLSTKVMQIQDDERRRIAQDLHDGVGQTLSGALMTLGQAKRSLSPKADRSEALLKESEELVQESLREVRTVSHLLHPPLLDESGLASAIRWYVEGFSKRSNIPVKLDMDPDMGRQDADVETAVFRIIQEGLTNVHRHSGAKSAAISIKAGDETLELKIADDGGGIPAEALAKASAGQAGVGLASMTERTTRLGGKFHIESGKGGTAVFATFPVRESRENAEVNLPL